MDPVTRMTAILPADTRGSPLGKVHAPSYRSSVWVHLVRHGDVENPGDLRYGRLPGFPLSARGRAQVERTARCLASMTAMPRVTRVISSPLERATQTASLLASHLECPPVTVDERLTEAASPFDGLHRALEPRAYARRVLERGAMSRRETPLAVARRMIDAVRDLAGQASDSAIVLTSHQHPIQFARLAMEAGDGAVIDARAWLRMQFAWFARPRCAYGSITTLEIDPHGALCRVDYREA